MGRYSLRVPCPNCRADAGERCTVPTDTGRRPVQWTHIARDDAMDEALREGKI